MYGRVVTPQGIFAEIFEIFYHTDEMNGNFQGFLWSCRGRKGDWQDECIELIYQKLLETKYGSQISLMNKEHIISAIRAVMDLDSEWTLFTEMNS